MTLNTHRDPKQVPHTHTHTHAAAAKGSQMTEGGWRGGRYVGSVDRRAEMRREDSLWLPREALQEEQRGKRGTERRESIEKLEKNHVINAERIHALFP